MKTFLPLIMIILCMYFCRSENSGFVDNTKMSIIEKIKNE